MKLLALVALALAISFVRPVTALGVPGEVRLFIESIKGTYEIDLAGGHQPAPNNNQAEIFADTDAGVLVMPFCGANGLCDPGYIDLIYAKTQIARDELAKDHYRVEIRTGIGSKEYRYTWESEAGRITFTNYAYPLGGQLTTLQHSLHRVAKIRGREFSF